MDDYIARTITAYDDVEKYESNTKFLTPTDEIDELLHLIPDGAKVLDAGCAYGRDSDYMQKKGYDVIGFDLSASLIKRAQELHPTIAFSKRDVRDTGFENDSFDGIWCNATLLHLNDQDMLQALLELKRIVKPNGFIAVSLKKGTGSQTLVESFSSNLRALL